MIAVRLYEVVIDCADPRSLADFWMAFTGYIERHGDDDWVSIGAADGSVIIGFQKVPEPKTVKNRVHLDFAATDYEATAREIEALGASRLWVSENPDDRFVVLADPEGNEFCIVHGDVSREAKATADVLDEHPETAAVCSLDLRQFGGRMSFQGSISTLRCHEDNVLLKQRVAEPGHGRVLVVDGGGSLHVALLGDNVARTALESGWAGLVINGCVRDAAALAHMDIGVTALRTCPRPSAKGGGGESDIPVTFGGVTFTQGAMIYSDGDGVVVVG